MVETKRNGLRHPDLTSFRITKDKDVECLIDMLENVVLIHLQVKH